MIKLPFTKEEQELLRSLNVRVRNNLPDIDHLIDCIITGPAVAELAVHPYLTNLDKTFIIFAPNQDVLDHITDHVGVTTFTSFENATKYLSKYINWFTKNYLDVIAEDLFVSSNNRRNLICCIGDLDKYPTNFDAHPIYCLGGKAFVNKTRLEEAQKYVGAT